MVLFKNKADCCGCGVCMNACPKNAISMTTDEYGCVYPEINDERCVNCGICIQTCDFQKKHNEQGNNVLYSFGIAAKDLEIKKKSASGGVFAQIAKNIISKGGAVYGAAMLYEDDKLVVRHIRVNQLDELYRLQGSKYVHSNTGYIYKQVKCDLKQGVLVLFSGTPCQIAGLKSFLKQDYDNLITIDIVCHGVSWQQLFQDYIELIENTRKEIITDFGFRDKNKGWGLDARYEYIKNGKKNYRNLYYKLSSFYTLYLKAATYRENCYKCKYASPNRCGDITVGDFWGVEKNQPECLIQNGGCLDDSKGISICLINTIKGMNVFENNKMEFDFVETSFETVSMQNSNLLCPSKKPVERDMILKMYMQHGYREIESWFWKRIGMKKAYYIILAKAPRELKQKVKAIIKK